MKRPCVDLFCFSYIPEILSQITAGTSRHIHFIFILIVALWTFPLQIIIDNDLSIITTYMTVIGLCIKLRILDIIINKSNHILQCFQIVAHIRNLHIGDRSTGGNLLELALKAELLKSINLFPDIYMIRVGIVSLIRHILDLPKTLLINLSKTVTETFCRSTI